MITKMFIGDFIHVTADKIEWTPGQPKWIWHVRCDRCASWPGRTARSQDMGISMAEAHFNDTHSGIRDNNERERETKSRTSRVANESRIAKHDDQSSNGDSNADSRPDRWTPYYVTNGRRISKTNAAEASGNAAKELGSHGLSVNGDASKANDNAD